ncbi:hypothetical protein JGU71_29200 [Antrihabitans sp. YC3-6]|uniref:Uncharacterized protein n=1 Tax=Antrihabitans stalagmiti TaxID=2799499 RepID=A0A934NWP9_9NOCA|nr:DUF6527 family protein [Antrihabitans stalagmiti]MBJ8342971.1 hypothetical protein [Antrihabitans stalagmiti]
MSIEFGTCMHLCACGCGQDVVTPLSPAQWSIAYDGENVSLRPSVGNWTLPCQSHYILDRGRVHMARRYSRSEIARNRSRDRFALEVGFAEWTDSENGSFDLPSATDEKEKTEPRDALWDRLRQYLRRHG